MLNQTELELLKKQVLDCPKKDETGLNDFQKLPDTQGITIPYVGIGGVNLETMTKIAPYNPPLVAIVRAYQDIPKIQAKYFPT